MRVLLDTNRYGDLFENVTETVELIESAEAVFLPFVMLAELRAGFAFGRRQVENERVLRQFLSRNGVHSLFADEGTTHRYAAIYRQLRKQGTPIPTNDMWVAALALQHDLALHDRDKHFDTLPQLLRV
ncbi:MAG: type II toxin-antitoxin system VapC family toxin [Candidatus Eremiobacteraeota bacterium]|nr:type II toxin-antitoxin system VapC family toxin [Candidatus Eremiobacteraeota bacterium]MBV8355328.1 type II toxin-antitoxin system VapC family toxin [Candidatus Eremiobacteraeota bacterium]